MKVAVDKLNLMFNNTQLEINLINSSFLLCGERKLSNLIQK